MGHALSRWRRGLWIAAAVALPGATASFVTLDRRLAEAADREGLDVLTWPD